MKNFALLLLTSLFAMSNGQEMFGDDKKTFLLLPAEVVSSGLVGQVQFSTSGRYITYQKADTSNFEARLVNKELPTKTSWYRYDRTTKVNLKIQVPDSTKEVLFLGDDQTVFFSGDTTKEPQGFIDLKTGITSKTNFDLEKFEYYGELSWAPYFVFSTSDTQLMLVKPNGQSLSFKVPPKIHIFQPIQTKSKDIVFSAMISGDPNKVGRLSYSSTNRTAEFVIQTQAEWAADMRSNDSPREFWFEAIGDSNFIKLANLKKDLKSDLPTKAKLGAINCNPTFSPSNDCVAYEDAGALLLRDIRPMDSELARKLQTAAAKANAMSDAKQAALGLIVYASDADDVLPGAEGWEHKVAPYFKNADLLKNFNYTYKGGSLSSIANPSATELGFTMGPGGRAVAYADGSVKWVPNP